MAVDTVETWHPFAPADEIPAGEMAAREIGDMHVVVYNVNGALFATDNICTHAYAHLSDGWLDGDIIECPLHGGQFNVKTGEALGDPVSCDLRVFPVRVQDGRVEIQLR